MKPILIGKKMLSDEFEDLLSLKVPIIINIIFVLSHRMKKNLKKLLYMKIIDFYFINCNFILIKIRNIFK